MTTKKTTTQSEPKSQSKLARRGFLKATGAAALTAGVWSEVSARESTSPNQKLKILCVGTANRAAENIKGVAGEDVVGLCDIDRNYLDLAAEKFPHAKQYADYREMIAAQADTVDAVVIGTTDHHHAPASLLAINSGLHCYCEKPLTHTVQEARIIAEAAKKNGVATQMGTQIHAGDNYRRVVEIIQSGVLGDIKEVHVWVGSQWGGGDRSAKVDPIPEYLSWDLWLGAAPERPYVSGPYHPVQWRRWWDFGQGTLGDMGCHYMDLPFWALDLRYPISIEADGPEVHPETCPTGLKVHYKFPARGELPGLNLTWYDGDRAPKQVAGENVGGSGVMFIGSEGKMFADYSSYRLYPEEKFSNFTPPPQTIPKSLGHHAEWIKACKEGTPTTCNFDYSGAITETVLLGNVAYRVGQQLDWDGEKFAATNCPDAIKFLQKTYRTGWEVKPTV